jgi:hypothetical protein
MGLNAAAAAAAATNADLRHLQDEANYKQCYAIPGGLFGQKIRCAGPYVDISYTSIKLISILSYVLVSPSRQRLLQVLSILEG